jgi:hypothetical protein
MWLLSCEKQTTYAGIEHKIVSSIYIVYLPLQNVSQVVYMPPHIHVIQRDVELQI